jgi:class 3 adenylate cyclase/tetratricopeptide (TPR) repeat protein
MKCPICQFENPEGKKFCTGCGAKLEFLCPHCNAPYTPQSKFCGDCGQRLDKPTVTAKPIPLTDSERKHITVLFSDMSGYTAMTEKLDPEEVKEIMGRVFGEISQVVARYEGFIEKFIGDAVMALFGAVTAHEDDPVRAIKAAREIHDVVSSLSPQYEKRIGRPLTMHTGICTGLVVTGDVNLEKGTHGVLGDTINTASRLSGLAKPGEIVISSETYHQAEGYFTFEPLEVTHVKGRAEAVKPYKVISQREDPTTTHRLSGLRAELIGRKVEMAQLQEALQNLKQGEGSIFSIVGDAGTGKSRLIEEFKSTINPNEVQWREGHAYAYSENIPYFPVIDLLSRAWQIHEGDGTEQIRQKVETGARSRLGDREDLIPYVGSLYSLSYPEIEQVSPDYWKARLHETIRLILADLCKQAPAVICVEDLHWADPSSVELLRNILADFRVQALFLCIYRPTFNLFTSHQMNQIKSYQEIRLQDLSPTDAQSMVESLLKTESVPGELKRFIRDKIEGNPFFLEEVINSLLETETLIHADGQWTLTKPISEANVPSTVEGVISARLDRLEIETKRILQEASVIGRAFLYEILKRITELKEQIDLSLVGLERLDLIRTRALQPDLEYIFKHALTQEVVYNGLLKKERQNIHEKIGQVMENIFHDRLPEFYEALAYHYKQGHSTLKAVDYLMKAGQKNLKRYALEESHQYYKEGFELLSQRPDKTKEDKMLLVDLLLDWAVVYYRRAFFIELGELLRNHEDLVVSLEDKSRLGMYYVRLGSALGMQELLREAYQCLHKALGIGEDIGDLKIIGYASAHLAYVCGSLGLLDEAIALGKRVQTLDLYSSDPVLFTSTTTALCVAYFFKGEVLNLRDTANALIDYGQKHSYTPSLSHGYALRGYSYLIAGDFPSCVEYGSKAKQVALEPVYSVDASFVIGHAYLANGQYREAEVILREAIDLAKSRGYAFTGTMMQGFYGIVMITQGNLQLGVDTVEAAINSCHNSESWYRYATNHYSLGRVYLQMAQGGGGKKELSFYAKNIGFLIKTVPFAYKKAEDHLTEAMKTCREIGAKGLLGQATLDMGRLHRAKGRTDEARKEMSEAVQLFEICEADVFLKQAREELAALG